jgi:hypothetical protein
MFLIYVPPFHAVFGGSHKLLPLYWLIPIAFGCVTLAWASIRVLLARRSIDRTRVKDIKGLMMCKFHSCSRGEQISSSHCHSFPSPNDAHDEYALSALVLRRWSITRNEYIRSYTRRSSLVTLNERLFLEPCSI